MIYERRGSDTIAVSNDGVIFGEKTVGGITYFLCAAIDANKRNTVVWEMEGYRFKLVSKTGLTELWKTALSVDRQ